MKTPRTRNLKNVRPTENLSNFDDSQNKSRTAAGRGSPFSHRMFNFSGTGASFRQASAYYGQQSTKKAKRTSSMKKHHHNEDFDIVNPFNPYIPKEEEDFTIKPHLMFQDEHDDKKMQYGAEHP